MPTAVQDTVDKLTSLTHDLKDVYRQLEEYGAYKADADLRDHRAASAHGDLRAARTAIEAKDRELEEKERELARLREDMRVLLGQPRDEVPAPTTIRGRLYRAISEYVGEKWDRLVVSWYEWRGARLSDALKVKKWDLEEIRDSRIQNAKHIFGERKLEKSLDSATAKDVALESASYEREVRDSFRDFYRAYRLMLSKST
jgi:hypothetical protein